MHDCLSLYFQHFQIIKNSLELSLKNAPIGFFFKDIAQEAEKDSKEQNTKRSQFKNHLYELDVKQFQKKVFWKIAIWEELEFGLINLVYQNFHSDNAVSFIRNNYEKKLLVFGENKKKNFEKT